MIVDYVSNTISCLRWNSTESSINSVDGNYLVTSTHWELQNQLNVFNVNRGEKSLELVKSSSKPVECSVQKLATFGKSNVIACKENGSASLYSVDQTSSNYQINEIKNWSNLSNLPLTDIVVDLSKKSLVLSGEDGYLHFIDINSTNYKATKSKEELSKSSITCIELLNTSEYIFGNEIGSLKLYDVRKGEVNLNFNLVSNLSSINCVRKHKGNNYIVACGNDQGVLRIIDLRNTTKDLQLIAAHEAPITELKYKNSEPNTIITSSLDGELLKWTFSVDSVNLVDVYSIFGTKGSSSILSFDLNVNDWLAFSTDLESIYCSE